MRSMKQSGRISPVALGSLFCVLCVVVLMLFSRESAASAGARFMEALQHHDVDTLTQMTKMDGASEADIHKQWDFAVNNAEKYYAFGYKVEGASQSGKDNASVKISMIRDIDHPGSYEEQTELPMVKVNGDWKVDVRATSRDFFNCLPR